MRFCIVVDLFFFELEFKVILKFEKIKNAVCWSQKCKGTDVLMGW